MADDTKAKATIAKVVKLLTVLRDLDEKRAAVMAEIDTVLEGKASIGDLMREFSEHFDRLWGERYAGGQTGHYIWTYAKDKPHVKRLIQTLGVEELKARAVTYLRNDDAFYARARHSFGAFVASINSHAAPAAPVAGGGDDYDLRPADCRHVPPCRTDQEHTKRKMSEMRS